jgi:hypothetical protein
VPETASVSLDIAMAAHEARYSSANTLQNNELSARDVQPGIELHTSSSDSVSNEIFAPSPALKDFTDRFGSANVPMDSWIYPALERLAALGFIPSQSVAIRPWTRKECLRQVEEAQRLSLELGLDDIRGEEADGLVSELLHEVTDAADERTVSLESVYARYGTIAGPALTDGYHFGQTWWNDFGRPLGRGGSAVAGFSLRASRGRFFFYDRQELQQAPGTLAITTAQSQFINTLDNSSFGGNLVPNFYPPTSPTSAYLRQRPIELYGGIALGGTALSFGKQQLYWGPTTMGPLAFSSNAEPTYNLQWVATRPHAFPFAPQLGSYRFDFVFGKLSGHKYPARPYYNGVKVDMSFGHNFEVSFTRWSVLWGVGHPMTLHSLKANLFSVSSTGAGSYASRDDPGDRKSGFDFRLHVPGVNKLITIYADAYADDELNPIDAPRRVVWSPGVYFARLPYLPHADLRLEAVSSEELSQDEGGTRFFINNQYRDSNTNKGFLLGNAIGRDGRAIEALAGYWFSARTRIELGYRQSKISEVFLPFGGTIGDQFATVNYALTRDWSAHIFAQHERFLIPSMLTGQQHNVSGWINLTWNPKISHRL